MKSASPAKQRDKFVEENLGLVHACAGRFRGRGVEYDDLYQNLALCLILSVEEYDSSFGPLRPYLYRQLQEELRNNREYPRAEQEEYRDSQCVGIHRESSL